MRIKRSWVVAALVSTPFFAGFLSGFDREGTALVICTALVLSSVFIAIVWLWKAGIAARLPVHNVPEWLSGALVNIALVPLVLAAAWLLAAGGYRLGLLAH